MAYAPEVNRNAYGENVRPCSGMIECVARFDGNYGAKNTYEMNNPAASCGVSQNSAS